MGLPASEAAEKLIGPAVQGTENVLGKGLMFISQGLGEKGADSKGGSLFADSKGGSLFKCPLNRGWTWHRLG